MNRSRVVSMNDAVSLLEPGDRTLALGGNSIHRVPHAFVHALARREDLSLHLVKTAGAYDIDLLCLSGIVTAVSAGFVGYEAEFGLARHYRRAVEGGVTEAREHACYTVITALRAAAYGLTFMPARAMYGSDLPAARGFTWISDPYRAEEEPVVAIPAITPDLAVIHVQFADTFGNGVIVGPKNEDLLMARSADRVVLTAEQIVAPEHFPVPMDHIDIPGVLVDAVVEAPGGAWPGTCAGAYDADADAIRRLIGLQSREELMAYLDNELPALRQKVTG